MKIQHVPIEISTEEHPRNDTANVLELRDGRLMVVWQKYSASSEGGSDFGICRIHSKISDDGGMSWRDERVLVDVRPEDMNVQAPALCMLPSGEILLICLRAHGQGSTTMELYRSTDKGKTFDKSVNIWERSNGQWLQGGANSLLYLSRGRLLLPFHCGTGLQGSQHNIVKCYISDDGGDTWRLSKGLVDLPLRGAMEASVAELDGGNLVMSLRTQLGSFYLLNFKRIDSMPVFPCFLDSEFHSSDIKPIIRL